MSLVLAVVGVLFSGTQLKFSTSFADFFTVGVVGFNGTAGSFQIFIHVYLAAAHVDFEGKNSDIENNNQGYAFVAGIGLNF